MTNCRNLGFTLIELSIVLVVIGLLVGGVLVGRDLIKSATIRSQIKQIEELETAVGAFKVKYGYLPGDMPPSDAAQLGFFTFTGAYAGKVCTSGFDKQYGNNDGRINQSAEIYPFWSHLGDSKLIANTFGGTAGSLIDNVVNACAAGATGGKPIVTPNSNATFEQFMPVAKLPFSRSSGATITEMFVYVTSNYYYAPDMSYVYYSNTNKQNLFRLWDLNLGLSTTPFYSYHIDTKIDDGDPSLGNVRERGTADGGSGMGSPDVPGCTTVGLTPKQYDLSAATVDVAGCMALDFLF